MKYFVLIIVITVIVYMLVSAERMYIKAEKQRKK